MKYSWKKTGIGSADYLGLQLQKVARKMNGNKLKTRYRYIEANERFIKYLGEEFKVRKLINIKDKHLEKYVEKLKVSGASSHYIKVELSAIRFLHNELGINARSELAEGKQFNKKVGLGKTKDGRVDRAWEDVELERFKKKAIDLDKKNISDVLETVRTLGLRLDEVCTLKTNDITNALKTGKLDLTNTKGGKRRVVPVNDRAREILANKINKKESILYPFIPTKYVEAHKIHTYEKSIQNFIYFHRDKIQNEDRSKSAHNLKAEDKGALTMHGLRHAYAREEYLKRVNANMKKDSARYEVAQLLGHGRDSVTYIYLGGIE